MPAKFTYDKLNHSRKEVRYLRVLPKSGAVIQCTLQHVPLEPGHICLSHRWTDKEGLRDVFINDKPFTVSANIWNFLDVARRKYDKQERFWIDAICINQQDNAEKNKQVPLMGEIYSSAKLVVSWLGECDAITKRCIDVIRSQKIEASTNHFHRAISEEDIFWADFWDHLLRFFQNDYWKRAWVVQEVLLATDGYLLVGDIELDWGSLIKFWNLIIRNDLAPQTHSQRLSEWNFGHEQQPRQAVKSGQFAPLRSLVARYGKQSCSDFHDRVYSLLSLAKERELIVVDYGSSKETLFFNTLRDCGFEKCFCFATCLMNILRLGSTVKRKAPFMTGAWHTTPLPTDEDSKPFTSFGINSSDWLILGDGISYEYFNRDTEDPNWLRSLPPSWKRLPGKNVRFLYTAVPADFLLRQHPATGFWFCKAIRFHHGKAWTRHVETFYHDQDSGIHVHHHEGTNRPCCIQLSKSALLKLLMFGEQHTVCHEPSFNGFSMSTIEGRLECGQPIERYAPNVIRRVSVPYRSCSIPATPKSTPRIGYMSVPGNPAQVRNHAQALRRSLFQVKEYPTSSRPVALRPVG